MSSRKRIVIVAKKEIIEFIRDWRTIVALVLIPLLLFPLLFIAFPVVMQNEAAELEQRTVDILIQSNDIEDSLVDLIENQTALVTIIPLDENLSTLSDANNDTEELRNLEYDAILRIMQYCIYRHQNSPMKQEVESWMFSSIGRTIYELSELNLQASMSSLLSIRCNGMVPFPMLM